METKNYIFGVEPDAPVIVNKSGGKQSSTPYGFHLLPTSALFDAAKVCKEGADKYGETLNNRNYTKISTEDHLNHALQHIYAFLAGDTQDDHLGHAMVRLMFAYDVNNRVPAKKYADGGVISLDDFSKMLGLTQKETPSEYNT